MSDLIDFDSPSTENVGVSLPVPLIPVPENLKNDESNSNEAGPPVVELEKRRSIENNPFDVVMKKIIDYERNKEDPFETVTEKAKEFKNKVFDESKDAFISQSAKYSDTVKMNKISEETDTNLDMQLIGDNDISIISDLNNTNLISESENPVASLLICDNKIPSIHISSSYNTDLSILNNSSMNDSLLEHESNNVKDIKSLLVDTTARYRSMSQTNVVGNKKLSPQNKNRRSMSTSDAIKNNNFIEDCLLNSAHSSVFDDPFNNAFRKNSLRSTISSNSSSLSNQFDLSKNLERQTSNSSVFSGLSNVSTIPTDPSAKIRHDRFYSESSTFSGLSNLSTISNNIVSSSDSSVFSNDTLNKGFITSRIHSSNSLSDKSPLKARDNSDLIKKFFEIKTQMSTSESEQPKNKNNKDNEKTKNNSLSKSNISQKKENHQNSDELLIDVDSSFVSVFNEDTGVNDIISHEAKLLAETFEKMANENLNYPPEDDLLSKTQLNFDYLPKSDDETVDNLIELPGSPTKDVLLSELDINTEKCTETKIISPKDKIRDLENEFIEKKDFDKKAVTATLMLDLEKVIKEQNNPDAFKVLNDLQKLLGVECDNNTEILQLHLQDVNDSLSIKNNEIDNLLSCKSSNNNNCDLNTSKPNVLNNSKNNSNVTTEISNNKNCNNISNSKLNVAYELKEKIKESDKIVNKPQHTKESEGNKNNSDHCDENKNLAKNLINTLNQIVNENNETAAVEILRSLGTVLSMTTELQANNMDKQITDSKVIKPNTPMKLNRSSNSLYKSPSSTNFNPKNKSFEVLPLRRSVSTHPIYNNNSFLDNSFIKNKRQSQLLNIKKRFPSDPGFKNVVMEKKSNEISIAVEPQFNLKTSKTVEQVKTKFKKKLNSEVVTKKGPLKAVIPLGNMQKRGSTNQKSSLHNITPPKSNSDSVPPLNIVSSTPNTSGINKTSKSQPTASSTPNIEGLKTPRTNVQKQRNSKSTLMCNVSPVSMNSSMKAHIGTPRSSSKRMERTLSPQKRPLSPKKNIDCSLESRLPRYSPRPMRVRNYSLEDLKSVKSLQNIGNSPKFSSEKKLNRQPVSNPLKNYNKFAYKSNMQVSRIGKLNNSQLGAEKENYA